MAEREPPPQMNISAVRVAGVGGAGLLVMVLAMAVDLPAARWLLVGGICGGLVTAVALVAWHRRG